MKIRDLLKKEIDELNKYEVEDTFFKAKNLLAFEMNVKIDYF